MRTVAGTLAGALERVLRLDDVTLTCAGRTDAGVHAWDQWVHADIPQTTELDEAHLARRLVKLLGPEIVVRSVSRAPEGWDARHSALARTYRYDVLTAGAPDPFRAGFVWWLPGELDLRAMQLACDAFIGEHDFASFCRQKPDGTLVRRILDAGWTQPEAGLLRFEVTANAFCQQMVRSIVGTLVEVGTGRRTAGDMLGIIKAGDRSVAAPVAPPDGLTLWRVTYPREQPQE